VERARWPAASGSTISGAPAGETRHGPAGAIVGAARTSVRGSQVASGGPSGTRLPGGSGAAQIAWTKIKKTV
jgi:hypothetical protein